MFRASPIALLAAGPLVAVACGAPAPSLGGRTDGVRPATFAIDARGATDQVPHDPDDPAVWVDAADPSSGLIIGTDKAEGRGGLYVFGMDGRLRQAVTPLDRPNNVDVEYGLAVGDSLIDIAVVTERMQRRLRVFRIDRESLRLEEVTSAGGIPVLEGQPGEAGEPMGVGLFKRRSDGAVFALVSPKTGGTRDYLWQYRLHDDGRGRVAGTLVRRFGAFSGASNGEGEIEAIAVDDELGFVYYADELFGLRKWSADPDHPDAGRELAVFGTDGYAGDREGLAVYAMPGGGGWIVSSDQVPGSSRIHLYTRSGGPGDPHAHRRVAILETGADGTDGLEAVPGPVGAFRRGVLVMMHSAPRTFLIFDWSDIDTALAAAGSAGR